MQHASCMHTQLYNIYFVYKHNYATCILYANTTMQHISCIQTQLCNNYFVYKHNYATYIVHNTQL